MDVKHVNPFIESFAAVMPQIGFGSTRRGDLSVRKEVICSGVIVLVGVVGAIKGNVVYCIDLENAKKIASTMMMGTAVNELDEMSQSALSELTNMLTANAATSFANQGITIDISTPTMIQGENISVKMGSDQVVCIQLIADESPVEINIAFEK